MCGGDGGIGGPGGDVGSMGSAGYGGGFGNAVSFDGNTPGYGSATGIGDAIGGPSGTGVGGPSYYNNATQIGPKAGTGAGTGGLGTPYPTIPPAPTWGSGGTTQFNYPTPQEVHDTVYGLPYMQNQARILGNMESMPAFRSAVMPEIQGVMKTLGRSGIPSSSMADRMITDQMGSLYNKWMWNVLTGYQNMGVQLPQMMNQWYQPYDKMLAYLGS